MSRLYLLRHAKAGWAAPGMRDFDRPLEPGGVADAQAIGAVMMACGHIPDRVLCSSSRRTRETWDGVAKHLGQRDDVVFSDALYGSDATGYLDAIREAGEAQSVLVVGHNPMTEDIAFALAGSGEEEAMAALAQGFPASGLAIILFEGSLADAAPRKGYLDAFLTPADL
jgi:phosphohistidine phosphatase